MKTIGDGQPGINSFGSNIVFDTFNNRVFNHEVFGISKRFNIAASGSIDIVIDPTEKGVFPKDTLVFLPAAIFTYGGGPANIDIYIGTDSDADGTEWEAIDRNLPDAVTPHVVVRLNPTINDDGTQSSFEDRIESSSGQGVSSDVGGSVKDDFIIIPYKTLRTMTRITNTDTVNALRGVFKLNWFEVNKAG